MKNLLLLPILLILLACGSKDSSENTAEQPTSSTEDSLHPSEKAINKQELSEDKVQTFGAEFLTDAVRNENEMLGIYKNLKPGDTLAIQFKSEVESVCAKKGCWMKLKLPEGQNTHVTFKDYGFFVPKDSPGQSMLVNGMAFIEETDVETLKHYAEDAGKSEAEIAKISEPQLNYRFIATGAKAVE